MRFDRIRVHAMGPFKGLVDVDLAGLPGPLVAICGANGAGKTTLLELLAGALYRECPTRGTLASLATARDAFVEVSAVNGQAFTVRQHVDAVSGKGETVVMGPDGGAVLQDTKVREFDRWIARHVVSSDVLYASSFSVQGRRGFLDLKASERKELLVEVLGLKRLERMADAARERARAAKASLETHQTRLKDLPAPAMDLLARAVDAARQQVIDAEEAARGARVALERARAVAGDATRTAELVEQRRAAVQRRALAHKQAFDLDERINNNRALLDRGDEIRSAVARAAELDKEVEEARDVARAAERANADARAQETEARAAHTRALEALGQAQSRVLRIQARLKDRDQVLAAGEQVAQGREREAELDVTLTAAETQKDMLEGLVLGLKDQRIGGLRGGLEFLAEAAEAADLTVSNYSRGVLAGDNDLSARGQKAPDELAAARSRIAELRKQLGDVAAYIAKNQALAARAGEIAQAEADHAHAQADEHGAAERLQAAALARDTATAARAEVARAVEAAEDAVATKRSLRIALDPTLVLRPRLEQAEARIEELTAQVVPARAALAQVDAELASLPVVDASAAVDVGAFERTVTNAEQAERTRRDELSRATMAVERAHEALAARKGIEEQVAEAEADLGDWTRLALDLGKDGLQAMEIDSALPEWTEIANSLLHTCLGPRFTVELRTDRLSADGKRVLEDLEARVLDTVNGRDADAATYSGGELVLVGSALSLGLTTLACRRAGVERPTICLDEAGAALDDANGRAWIAMLRMAARQIGADKVLYISHSGEAQLAADARIRITDGAVNVD
jgi:exonuclease SbcC